MSHSDESKRPETTRGEMASSGMASPRRAASLRRTLNGLGVDPTCLMPDQSPSDLANPPTLLRLPAVSHETRPVTTAAPAAAVATAAVPPAVATTPAVPAAAVPAAVAPTATVPTAVVPTAVAPVAAVPQETHTAPSPALADAPRPRPEPPTDWQNVIIQWLAAGLAAVAVLVIFTKWRDRPAPAPHVTQETLQLQVSAPASPENGAELPPEPPVIQDKSVRMAGATRHDRLASPATRPTATEADDSPSPAAARFEHRDEADAPQEVDGARSASPAPDVPDTTVPDDGGEVSYDYPRTNPATYLYIDPPAATAPRFQPRGAGGMAARGATN